MDDGCDCAYFQEFAKGVIMTRTETLQKAEKCVNGERLRSPQKQEG